MVDWNYWLQKSLHLCCLRLFIHRDSTPSYQQAPPKLMEMRLQKEYIPRVRTLHNPFRVLRPMMVFFQTYYLKCQLLCFLFFVVYSSINDWILIFLLFCSAHIYMSANIQKLDYDLTSQSRIMKTVLLGNLMDHTDTRRIKLYFKV